MSGNISTRGTRVALLLVSVPADVLTGSDTFIGTYLNTSPIQREEQITYTMVLYRLFRPGI